MLSREENEILTRVGPGTLMGNLLRRYWTPACLSREIEADGSPLEVRLLGEDLVAFRDSNGKVGLFDKNCPHRGASLFYGRNEECGLRCIYHGWKFDVDGNCVDMPNEPRPFADRIKIPSYPVHESGGIVWTYMGPKETMTPFRDFGSDSLPPELVTAGKIGSDCNWVQAMEGNLDSAHISFLHQYFGVADITDDGTDRPGYPTNLISWKFWRHDRAPRFEMEETWYGYRYAAVRTTPNGHKHVRINAFVMPYGTCVARVPFGADQTMFVPIDDEHCWRYNFVTQQMANPRNLGGPPRMTDPSYPYVNSRPRGAARDSVSPRLYTAENHYQIDRSVQRSDTYSGIRDFVSQDFMATESMGPIYDRTKEHLGTTDVPIIQMRQILVTAAQALEVGGAIPALVPPLGRAFRDIRSAEKILEPEEEWRVLGTDDDPAVQESFMALSDVRPD